MQGIKLSFNYVRSFGLLREELIWNIFIYECLINTLLLFHVYFR